MRRAHWRGRVEAQRHAVVYEAQLSGKWVAVKRGWLLDARSSPYQVARALRERRIRGAAIMQVPAGAGRS